MTFHQAVEGALLSLRIDGDVIEWFRAQGPGYQSRMNALLGFCESKGVVIAL